MLPQATLMLVWIQVHKIINAKGMTVPILELDREISEEEILFILKEAGIHFGLSDWEPNDLNVSRPEKYIRIAASIVDLTCLVIENKEKKSILPAYLVTHPDIYTSLLIIFSAVFLAIKEGTTFSESYQYVQKNYRLTAIISKEGVSNN